MLEGALDRCANRLCFEVFRLRSERERCAEPQAAISQFLVGELRSRAKAAFEGQENAAMQLTQPHDIRQI